MMHAIGLSTDSTFSQFCYEANRSGLVLAATSLRSVVEEGSWSVGLHDDRENFLSTATNYIELKSCDTYFQRVINLESECQNECKKQKWNNLVLGLETWLQHHSTKVVNPPLSGLSNGSKPLHQYTLQKLGFHVPPSLTSSNRIELAKFISAGPTILKTICGVRAMAKKITLIDLKNYSIERGPILVQRYVQGTDVRLHVVGERIFAMSATSTSDDYRTDDKTIYNLSLSLPSDLARAVIDGSNALGLSLSGWDFRLNEIGEWWCLEANPMPGFGEHDKAVDGEISRAICSLLSRRKNNERITTRGKV